MVDAPESERPDSGSTAPPSTAADGAIGSRIRSATDARTDTVTFIERGSPDTETAAWITVDASVVVDVADMG